MYRGKVWVAIPLTNGFFGDRAAVNRFLLFRRIFTFVPYPNPAYRMKITRLLVLSAFGLSAMVTLPSFGQYYPGSTRSGMGGGIPQASGPARPAIPNIAGDIANKETKWLRENLALDKEQAKAVRKLNNEYADQQQAAIKDIVGTGTQPPADTRGQIQAMMVMLNEEKEDQLKTLLTPEQWKTYQAKKPDMQRSVGGFGQSSPPNVSKPDSTRSTKQ